MTNKTFIYENKISVFDAGVLKMQKLSTVGFYPICEGGLMEGSEGIGGWGWLWRGLSNAELRVSTGHRP